MPLSFTGNEIKPRYSRSLIRNAVAQYKELFDSAAALASEQAVKDERTDLLMMYALPLLHIDSTTAAYLRAAPILTDADLDTYLAPFKIPLFHRSDAKNGPGEMDLRDQMRSWIDVDAVGDANHVQHIMGSMVIYRWLSACLRWCAQMSCREPSFPLPSAGPPASLTLWPFQLKPAEYRYRQRRSRRSSNICRLSTGRSNSSSITSRIPTVPSTPTASLRLRTATLPITFTCAG